MSCVACGRVCVTLAAVAVMSWGCSRDNPDFDGGDDSGGKTTAPQTSGADSGPDVTSDGSADGDGTSTSSTSTSSSASDSNDTSSTGAVTVGDGPVPVCGDGVLGGDEQCDDENNNPFDGCDACQKVPCGNGIHDQGEACDDAVDEVTACNNLEGMNTAQGDAFCAGCEWDTAGCYICGDGVLHDAEQCEPAMFPSFACVDNVNTEGAGEVSCTTQCQIDAQDCCFVDGANCPFGDALCCSGNCVQDVCQPA